MATDKNQIVESLLDQVLAKSVSIKEAVSSVVDGDREVPTIVEMTEDFACTKCGSHDLSESVLEQEGEEIPFLHCEACDTAYFEAADEDEAQEEGEDSEDEPSLVEAELDDENPTCPACESDRLDVQVEESEGEQHNLIVCLDCGAAMIPVED